MVKELRVHGMKITLNLKTLDGEKAESATVVEGIKVTRMNGDGSLLSLVKLYTKREIPVDKEEIATPAKLRNGSI